MVDKTKEYYFLGYNYLFIGLLDRRNYWHKVTVDDIMKIEKEYRNSEEEQQDVLKGW